MGGSMLGEYCLPRCKISSLSLASGFSSVLNAFAGARIEAILRGASAGTKTTLGA